MDETSSPIDYLVVGHITQDLTPRGPRLGGTATYAALTAQALGRRAGIVTAAAADAPTGALAGLPTLRIDSAHSTTFENIYDRDGRTQFLRAAAAPIPFDAVPREWQRAKIVHLAPVARELESDLAARFPDSFVGLTLQGWLRGWDASGLVRRADWPEAEVTLRSADAAVISLEDVNGDLDLVARWARAARLLVVTQGADGATVHWRGESRHSPAPAVTVIDPTGAGDIFSAAFFVRLSETGDAWQAAQFAVQLASASVTREARGGIPTPTEVVAARNLSRM